MRERGCESVKGEGVRGCECERGCESVKGERV